MSNTKVHKKSISTKIPPRGRKAAGWDSRFREWDLELNLGGLVALALDEDAVGGVVYTDALEVEVLDGSVGVLSLDGVDAGGLEGKSLDSEVLDVDVVEVGCRACVDAEAIFIGGVASFCGRKVNACSEGLEAAVRHEGSLFHYFDGHGFDGLFMAEECFEAAPLPVRTSKET